MGHYTPSPYRTNSAVSLGPLVLRSPSYMRQLCCTPFLTGPVGEVGTAWRCSVAVGAWRAAEARYCGCSSRAGACAGRFPLLGSRWLSFDLCVLFRHRAGEYQLGKVGEAYLAVRDTVDRLHVAQIFE